MQNRWNFKLFGSRHEEPTMSKSEAKRRLSTAIALMTDRPDGVADISDCGLTVIPKDFFHLCNTYLKTTIICSNNNISNLESGGDIGNLRRVQTLDCHKNGLEKLPLKIGDFLPSLVLLNLSHNRLTSLPPSFSGLKSLKVLLLSRNKFSQFPSPINQLIHLEQLDISGNTVTSLPVEFGRLTEVKMITLDVGKMTYPTREICELGLGAIMEHLRKDSVETDSGTFSGGEAEAANHLSPAVGETLRSYLHEDEKMRTAIKRYNNDSEMQRGEMLRFQAAVDEDQMRHATSVYKTKATEQKALQRMMEELQMEESYLRDLTSNVEKGKKNLAEALREMEGHSQRLLAQLTSYSNERASLWRSYESDARKDDLAWTNLHTQLEASKRKAVLDAMKFQIEDTARSDSFYKHLMSLAKIQVDNVVNMHRDEETRYGPMVNKAKMEQDNIINSMLMNERVQQEMFKNLQLKTDTIHQRILRDLALLENELSALSLLEQKQRGERDLSVKNCLEDERLNLAKMYQKLLQERNTREAELKAVLRDMEREAVKHEENFWLAAYHRLMETIPQSLSTSTIPTKTEQKIVDRVNIRKPASVVPTKSPETSPVSQAPGVPPVLHMETVCIVCMDRQSTAIFLPCGHICTCLECSSQVKECPLCRTVIARKLTLTQSMDEGA